MSRFGFFRECRSQCPAVLAKLEKLSYTNRIQNPLPDMSEPGRVVPDDTPIVARIADVSPKRSVGVNGMQTLIWAALECAHCTGISLSPGSTAVKRASRQQVGNYMRNSPEIQSEGGTNETV